MKKAQDMEDLAGIFEHGGDTVLGRGRPADCSSDPGIVE